MAKEPLTEHEQMELDMKKLELEERQQALQSRKISDELAMITLTEKKQELETKKARSAKGADDAKKAIEDRRRIQGICNHHTGGEGAMAIAQGQGDPERPTSMGAMQFLDQSIMVFCQRCFKEWHSDVPSGDLSRGIGPWGEGVQLWRRSINKQMAVVGGLVQPKAAQLPV
jgi:hypothetical protein